MKILFALLALAAPAWAQSAQEWMAKGDQQAREQQQEISEVLTFYQQLRDIQLEGPVEVRDNDPDWHPELEGVDVSKNEPPKEVFLTEEDYAKHQTRTQMRFKLELKDWKGTITYWLQNNAKVFATKPAEVYISNERYSGCSIQEGLVVRIAIGCPYHGTEGTYAKEFFQEKPIVGGYEPSVEEMGGWGIWDGRTIADLRLGGD